MERENYLIQMQRVGAIMRVTAIDPVSGREVVIQGPVSAGETALSLTAVRKLAYVLSHASEK